MTSEQALRFLAIGDSYTIGEAVQPEERWGHQLSAMMRKSGIPIQNPEIIAKTGWTTDELKKAIEEYRPKPPYDLVSLLIGVNNQYRGYAQDVYREEFSGLLKQAIALAGGRASRVIVLSIPDWGVTPFAEGRDRGKIAQEIDAFNAINQSLSEAAGVHYVNITPHSREHGHTMVASDGLHPSGDLYTYWSRAAFEAIQSLY